MVVQPEAVPVDASWTNLLMEGAALGKRQQIPLLQTGLWRGYGITEKGGTPVNTPSLYSCQFYTWQFSQVTGLDQSLRLMMPSLWS